MTPQRAASIESRASWVAACLTLAILSISYGAPLLVVVGLKPIQEASAPTARWWRWPARWSGSAPVSAAS